MGELLDMEKHAYRTVAGSILICAGFLLLGHIFPGADGETIIVAQDGNGDHMRIQDAIDNSSHGDRIEVWEGTYPENVVIDKPVALVGNGSASTRILGNNMGCVIRIVSDDVSFTGFFISDSTFMNSGIYTEGDGTIIKDNFLEDHGVGITVNHSNDNRIENNSVLDSYWGISLKSSGNNSINDNYCNDVSSFCIYVREGSDGNRISNNVLSDVGHAIYVLSSRDIEIVHNHCSNNKFAIRIEDVNDVIIENNTAVENRRPGIAIEDSDGIGVHNNTIANSTEDTGMQILDSSNLTIVNNSCSDNDDHGIWLGHCEGTLIISGNEVYRNGKSGILIFRSPYVMVIKNVCSKNGEDGIRISSSGHCILTNNLVHSNFIGISISNSMNASFTNNTIIGDGMWMDGVSPEQWTTHSIDETNHVNGEMIGYFVDQSNITIPDTFAQLILANCSDIIIANRTFSDSYAAVILGFSNNISMVNNTFSNNDFGVYLWGSKDIILILNSFSSSDLAALSLRDSHENVISGNDFSMNSNAINLIFSLNNSILNNAFEQNAWGIYLYGLSTYNLSDSNVIENNSFMNNSRYGIEYFRYPDGSIHAAHNFWGANTGPYHPTENPRGTGDNVSDHVIFDPWIGKEDMVNIKPTISIEEPNNNSGVSGIVTFRGSTSDLDGIVIQVDIDITDKRGILIALVNGTTNWTGEWDTRDYPDGEYLIRIRSYDGTDYSDEITVTLTVENKDDSDSGNLVFIIGMLVLVSLVLIVFFKRKIVIE